MEFFGLIAVILVGLMFWVIRSAITMGDTSRGDYQKGVAERKTAEALLEQTKQQSQQIELRAANERALVLAKARTESENQIDLLLETDVRYATVLFDGDDGGRQGSDKVVGQLSLHMWCKRIDLADDVSPDEMDEAELNMLPRFVRN